MLLKERKDDEDKPHRVAKLAREIKNRLAGILGGLIFFGGILFMTPLGGGQIALGIVVSLVGAGIITAYTNPSPRS